MCVEKSVHIIFDETNFLTSEQDTNDFKIGLANLEDDEDITKEQDQRTADSRTNRSTRQYKTASE